MPGIRLKPGQMGKDPLGHTACHDIPATYSKRERTIVVIYAADQGKPHLPICPIHAKTTARGYTPPPEVFLAIN